MHVAIINPFDALPGEGQRTFRYTMLANELASRGHKVTWITANFSHGYKKYRNQPEIDESKGLSIIMAPVPPYTNNISLQRVTNHQVYAAEVLKTLREIHSEQSLNLVVASIPPTVSARVAMEFCAEVKIPGVIDMQDPWPRVLESVFPKQLRSVLSAILLKSFRQDVETAADLASGFVTISPENLEYLSSFRTDHGKLPKAVFDLGLDKQIVEVPPRPPKEPNAPLTVAYIGNFGYMNDLETVVKAAAIRSNVQFVLIGDGPTYKPATKLAQKLKLTNVEFVGRVPFEAAIPRLLASDVGLVAHSASFPPSTVNKAFDYLCLGLPVISSLRGAFARDLEQFKFGLQYEAENAESLAAAIAQFDQNRTLISTMAIDGLAYAKTKMDGKAIYRQYADFLENQIPVLAATR
jgi:glycosyltransferase involved in cell wall biosynthesis